MKLGFSQQEIINTAKSLGLPTDGFVQRRVARAFDLVASNKVSEIDDGIFRVRSQYDASKAYIVNVNHGQPSCDCPDGERTCHCKHRIASLLYAQRQQTNPNVKVTWDDTENSYHKRGRWWVTDYKERVKYIVYRDGEGKLICPCFRKPDCEHRKAIRDYLNPNGDNDGDGNGNGNGTKRIVNDCGTEEAKVIQDRLNGTADNSQPNNGNGAHKAPSQDNIDPLSKPFVESERLDEQQILTGEGGNAHYLDCVTELKANIKKYTKKQQQQIDKLNEYVISYKGIMELAEKHHITFATATHSETHTVIAKGRCGTSERVSGKPMNGNEVTAMELAKRNAARQLLPLAEIKAIEHKTKLENDFDWQKAYAKCVELVGGKAQVDIIITDLAIWGKLRQDNPSHYNRTEWLLIREYCRREAKVERDVCSRRPDNWSYNSAAFIDRCREEIAKVRDDKAVDANEQPLEGDNGKRKLQMDSKLRTWLIEADGTKKAISCREICEQFEDSSLVTRLRDGIDSGADISTVELGN